ncbi:MAG: flagellar FliJ family protein [Chthonomonas sp.]|nr:flagellar FliJ family protein [Chthonomonas sp.]
MRKFEFRLAKVREFRHAVEEQMKAEWQEVQRRVAEAEDILKRQNHQLHCTKTEPATSLIDLKNREAVIQKLWDDISAQEAIIAIIQHDEEEARLAWLESKKEAKALDALYDQARAEYDLSVVRHEQAELDEWSTMRRKAA